VTASVDLRAQFGARADELLRRLGQAERESLLIKNWMSHDARWFMAAAREHGLESANRLNCIAAHELGKVEAQRIARALQLQSIATRDEFLLVQEIFIRLLGPDLLDYRVYAVDDTAYRIEIQRCFAFDNAGRAGIANQYHCGILARVTGWLEAFNLKYAIMPLPAKCLKAQNQECGYTITLKKTS
jgi:hypothetical protein